ncbi:MAG TPA: rhomboid family intramembrane serine protease [Bacteroidales bacterium]|nr:rhomboid family intramembrane serine protease [Bacteroidales bacterium]HQB22229.1 rhomboid family intramembrane serine protease [Bacteroidales bacterium]
MTSNIVLIIVIVTAIFTYGAWQREDVFRKFLLSPYEVVHRKRYYQIITHGFLHANWAHLIINMLVFWSFGSVVIQYFDILWGDFKNLMFLFFYLSAIAVSALFSIIKHKDNYYYSAVGASGATSAVVFASIFFNPWNKVYFFGILPIPGIVFGAIYLIYSYQMAKRGKDNIGHDAHFWGAVYGFVFPLVLKPELWEYFYVRLINFN